MKSSCSPFTLGNICGWHWTRGQEAFQLVRRCRGSGGVRHRMAVGTQWYEISNRVNAVRVLSEAYICPMMDMNIATTYLTKPFLKIESTDMTGISMMV